MLHKRKKRFDLRLSKTQLRANYEYAHLYNLNAKRIEFNHVNFKYALIDFCYFHEARFRDCDFTGAVIKDSNFRSAIFVRCTFDYCTFSNTILPYDQILANLPAKQGWRKYFLQNLRVNSSQTGEWDVIQKITLDEIKTTLQHLRNIYKHADSYYQDKYNTSARVKAFFQYWPLRLSGFLWNHGFSYTRVGLAVSAVLCLFSALRTYLLSSPASEMTETFRLLGDSIMQFFKLFLDYPGFDACELSFLEVTVTLVLRYVAIGIIVNIFYARNLKH